MNDQRVKTDKLKPLIGKKRDRLVNAAMKHSKKDLAILYVDTRWCFHTVMKLAGVRFKTKPGKSS